MTKQFFKKVIAAGVTALAVLGVGIPVAHAYVNRDTGCAATSIWLGLENNGLVDGFGNGKGIDSRCHFAYYTVSMEVRDPGSTTWRVAITSPEVHAAGVNTEVEPPCVAGSSYRVHTQTFAYSKGAIVQKASDRTDAHALTRCK